MGFYKRGKQLNAFFLQLIGACLVLCFCFASCAESSGRKDGDGQSAAVSTIWFYFSADGNLVKAENPSAIPSPGFKPWTEAAAVMDAGIAGDSPVLLVNKMGVLSAESISPSLQAEPSGGNPLSAFFQGADSSEPASIFPSAKGLSAGTAAGFAFEDGKTFVRFYRSSVFDDDRSPQPVALFLCGEAPYFPLTAAVMALDFGAKRDAQFVSLDYKGGDAPWLAAFKSRAGVSSGVSFEYFAFSALPGSAGFSSRSLSVNEFQSLSIRPSAESPPEAFTKMLGLLPSSYSVSMQIAGEGFPESSRFAAGGDGETLAAWGFMNEGMAGLLFADGTFYFSPAESGDIKALRFPRLNSGYIYTAFVFSKEWVLAGWEERRFYETGRSGIIAVAIPENFFS